MYVLLPASASVLSLAVNGRQKAALLVFEAVFGLEARADEVWNL